MAHGTSHIAHAFARMEEIEAHDASWTILGAKNETHTNICKNDSIIDPKKAPLNPNPSQMSSIISPETRSPMSALNVSVPSPMLPNHIYPKTSYEMFSSSKFLHDQPDISNFQIQTAALLLTTLLGLLSALDAQNECLHQETYALLDLVDDDNFQRAYLRTIDADHLCIHMYQRVIVPTAIGTSVLGLLALVLLAKSRKFDPRIQTTYPLFKILMLLYIPTFMVQIYNVAEIMLVPRGNTSESQENPYQSLAAVDRSGNVGDNANLFYMTWISTGTSFALAYQATGAFLRLRRRHRSAAALLPATSWDLSLLLEKKERFRWYSHVYKLRVRTGFWMATLVSCIIIVCSSQYIVELLIPYSTKMGYRQICRVYSEDTGKPIEYCRRTVSAWLSGATAGLLCVLALFLHHWARRKRLAPVDDNSILLDKLRQKRLPLNTELLLSLFLTLALGLNAVYCSGVRGPAAAVGNLYYSCWLSFFLCGRICLGCIEEFYHLDDEMQQQVTGEESSSYQAAYPLAGPQSSTASFSSSDSVDMERKSRMRRYFFLCIFSFVCAASAWDAASLQQGRLTAEQRYMIGAPCVVSTISLVFFLLCLSKTLYSVSSHFALGGSMALISFALWLGDLILTMHSRKSWAVDSIGEIKNANLYYYSWAAMITSGLQMSSYVSALFGRQENEDIASVAWLAICKVCFVIFGAALHVWSTIEGNCNFDEITSGAVTFCSRTVLANVVSLCGLLIGGTVVARRLIAAIFLCCNGPTRLLAHIELLISIFFVFLFGSGVAMITGIGGPGQGVGDLYYSTWLAFYVSIWLCYINFRQIQLFDGATQRSGTMVKEWDRQKPLGTANGVFV